MFYLPRAQRGFALFVIACLGQAAMARAALGPRTDHGSTTTHASQDDAGADATSDAPATDASGSDVSSGDASGQDASGTDSTSTDGAPRDVDDGEAPPDSGSSDAKSDGADAGRDARSDAPGIFLPGTQPGELTVPIRVAGICGDCHGQYADYDADGTWRGTMMANAARDPLFHAALTIARQDEPTSGDLCIRCHAPRAWLFGRSEPALISNLEPDDFESVQCDFCHRLNTGPTGTPYIGNGQYFVANDFVRRGPIRDAKAPHDFQYSQYHEESRICGLCHDVSNPLRNGFAIERTYTEWLTSSFATEGKSCQSCHMPSQRGFACGAPDMPERDVHAHEFAGGNYWMPKVIAGENPSLPRDPYEKTAKIAEDKLKTAADVTLQIPTRVEAGQKISFQVRVENKTGHKLPTGYPEGRRMWLEVEIADETGKPLFQSGVYDRQTATRKDDPQLRTYEVRMAANGVEGFHFILQDEVLQDNRIPPRGFVSRPDTKPVGREYPTVSSPDAGGPMANVLAHWDDAPYEFILPRAIGTTVVIRATLWYQTTSREYVEALRSANGTDSYGDKMLEIWERYDRAPPFGVATAMGSIEVDPPPPDPDPGVEPRPEPSPEAGIARDASSSPDAKPDGVGEGGSPTGGDGGDGGCSCSLAVSQGASYQASFALTLGFIGLLGRSRARPRRRRLK